MPVPQATAQSLGCPAGLEYLTQLDRLLVSRYREGKNQLVPTTIIWPALEIASTYIFCPAWHPLQVSCSLWEPTEFAIIKDKMSTISTKVNVNENNCLHAWAFNSFITNNQYSDSTCSCDKPYSMTVTDCYQRQVCSYVRELKNGAWIWSSYLVYLCLG